MFTTKHSILLGVGVGLIGIGILSFFISSQLQLVYVNETLEPDQVFSYNITSQNGALQKINVLGSEFEYSYTKPGANSASIHKANKINSSWNFDSDGTGMIKVTNIGNETVDIKAEFIQVSEPIWEILSMTTLVLGSIFSIASVLHARK